MQQIHHTKKRKTKFKLLSLFTAGINCSKDARVDTNTDIVELYSMINILGPIESVYPYQRSAIECQCGTI